MSYAGEADEMLYRQDREEQRRELLSKGWNPDEAEPCATCKGWGDVMAVGYADDTPEPYPTKCSRCLGTGVQP